MLHTRFKHLEGAQKARLTRVVPAHHYDFELGASDRTECEIIVVAPQCGDVPLDTEWRRGLRAIDAELAARDFLDLRGEHLLHAGGAISGRAGICEPGRSCGGGAWRRLLRQSVSSMPHRRRRGHRDVRVLQRHQLRGAGLGGVHGHFRVHVRVQFPHPSAWPSPMSLHRSLPPSQ